MREFSRACYEIARARLIRINASRGEVLFLLSRERSLYCPSAPLGNYLSQGLGINLGTMTNGYPLLRAYSFLADDLTGTPSAHVEQILGVALSKVAPH
jgi:hypothetical protein